MIGAKRRSVMQRKLVCTLRSKLGIMIRASA
jgi:hypothetical protein